MSRPKRKTPDLLSEVLAGSDAEQGHKEKLGKYSRAKRHVESVADHIVDHEPTLFKEASVLRACSSWLIFRYFYTAGQYRMIGGCTCKKHLLCAMCALRRSAKTVMAYSSKIENVMEKTPGFTLVLLTLTIKNGADLDERFTHLNSAITRMIKNRSNAKSGNRHTTNFRIIDGAAGAFEFKRGKGSGLWHPHVHMVALVPNDTDLLDLEWNISEEWRKLTKDSFNVDVTPIDMSSDESRMKAICEVFRYALKFGEMEIVDQVHAYKILKGRNLVRCFGSLRCKVPDDLNDSIQDELKLKPYIDLVYEYSKKKGYFLADVTDTGDQLTGCVRPKPTEGNKNARKIASKLHLQVKDLEKPWRKRSLDAQYMQEWIEDSDIEETYTPMEVPF